MGFVRFDEKGYLLDRNGEPFYLVGVNFAGGYVCTDFWADWRPDSIRKDLDQIKELGFNAVRIPLHWNTFEPEEGKFDPAILSHLDDFFTMCLERGIYVMPWCLVGVATGRYDVSWRNGRSFITDESMVKAEEFHLHTLGERYRDCEALLCWDICDEPEWYSKFAESDALPYPTDLFTGWVNRMAQAFRSADQNHLVTLGFGHIATGRYGMDLRDCANQLDFMAVTAYASTHGEPIASPRPGYELMFHMDMNRRYHPSFMCECPGWSHILATEESIAHLYNTTLYGGWLHGSAGALCWVFSFYDEDIITRGGSRSLEVYPAELQFGIVDEQRNVLKAGRALEAFGQKMRALKATDYSFRKAQAALIVSRGYHSTSYEEVGRLTAVHAALSASDIPLDMVWWDELDPSKYPLAVLKMTVDMTSSDWRLIDKYVSEGGSLLMLGVTPNSSFEKLFGAHPDESEHRFCDKTMRFEHSMGRIQCGDVLRFPENKNDCFVRLCVSDAEVIASYADGNPAILHNRCGKGQTWLIPEDMFAGLIDCATEKWRQSDLFRVLDAVADEAGVIRESVCRDPGVETGVLHSEKNAILIVINRNNKATQADVELRIRDAKPDGFDLRDGKFRLSLDSGEAKVIKLL